MLASEIIFRILTQIRSGEVSDDFNINEDLVFNQICSVRARLIRQEKSGGKYLSSLYIQDLGEIEMQWANSHDNCERDPRSCSILRSVNKLPKAIDTSLSDLYTFIGTVEGESFERTTSSSARFIKYSKYTGHKPKYYFIDDYLYVVHPKTNLLKYVNVQGVFENPLFAESFKKCGAVDCFENYNFEMPISASIVDGLIQLVITEIRGSRILPPDRTNDSTDNP